MAKKQSKSSLSKAQKVGLGVGLTAAAVTAAGAYFLYGSNDAKKNRTKVKSWMLKAKADVLETLEDVEHMSQAEYDKLIETVSSSYARLKNASKADIATFKREMKEHWPGIEEVGKTVKQAAVTAGEMMAKKPVKKAPKKTAQKSVKKIVKKATKKTAKKSAKRTTKKRA